jgi:hypothetical protein
MQIDLDSQFCIAEQKKILVDLFLFIFRKSNSKSEKMYYLLKKKTFYFHLKHDKRTSKRLSQLPLKGSGNNNCPASC